MISNMSVLICNRFHTRRANIGKITFLRATAERIARLGHSLGIRLSVRLFVSLVICIKTVQARITKFSLLAAPRTLVYRYKISCPWVKGFPSNENVKQGYPL